MNITHLKLTITEVIGFIIFILLYLAVLSPYYIFVDFITIWSVIFLTFVLVSTGLIFGSLKTWWKYRGRYSSESERPDIHKKLDELSEEMDVRKPKLVILDTELPNAYATDALPTKPIVILTKGILDTLNSNELDAVIAHELSHIKSYDIFFMMFLSTITSFIRRKLNYIGYYASREHVLVFIIFLSIPYFTLRAVLFLCRLNFFIISRVREYMADNDAAESTHPVHMRNSLIKINDRLIKLDNIESNILKNEEPLCIVPFINRNELFRTHPKLKNRVKNLEKNQQNN